MGWLSDWAKRIELTIDNTNVDSDLSDFPALIYISAASGIGDVDASAVFDELTSDANRKKIAVTTSDGTTQCYVEIERWDDANEKAWLWVKVLGVAAASSTTLYLYYDSSKADNTTYVGDTGDTPAQSVWDSDFVGVWHMAQNPNGDVADAIKDSTSNGNHGTPSGSMTTADLVDGLAGKALDFDGGDDRVNLGNVLPVSSDISISAVIKTSNVALDYQGIMAKCSGSAMNYGFYLKGDEVHFQFYNGGWKTHSSISANLSADTFYLVTLVFDVQNNTVKLYLNSGEVYSGGETTDPAPNAHDCYIGNDSGAEWFTGIIDTLLFFNSACSAAWLKATYYNIWDDLITWGSEETGESTFVEDVSLDLSAYGRRLENLQAFLRAHDGVELRDLQAELEAFGLSTDDFSTSLIAALESTGDFAANFETWATQYFDLAGDFDVKGQSIESLMSRFETAKAKYENLAAFLSVTDGSVLKDLAAFLSVTDGSVLNNLGLYLKAVQSVPAFRSITAQRVSSIVHEVS